MDSLTYMYDGTAYQAEIVTITEVSFDEYTLRVHVADLAGLVGWMALRYDIAENRAEVNRFRRNIEDVMGIYNPLDLKGQIVMVLKRNGHTVGFKGLVRGINRHPVLF